jgi:adenosylcobinamide-GDP ribazoletransferase
LLAEDGTARLAPVSIWRPTAPLGSAPPDDGFPHVTDPTAAADRAVGAGGPPWRGPREWARVVAVAFQFLTRLPVPGIPVVDGDLRRATAVFPLVGLVVGGCALATWAVLAPLLGTTVAAIGAVTVAVAVTGAFHEDGLADTFDGLWGGWDPDRRIEIMRDSRVGTYGACALVLSLAARVALLSGLAPIDAARVLLVGHVVARAAILVQIRWLPPVSDQGHGAKVAEPIGPAGIAVAATTTALVCGLLLGPLAPAPLLVGLLGVAAVRRAARRRLGGLTGDVLGATQQVVLLLAGATVVALVRAELL